MPNNKELLAKGTQLELENRELIEAFSGLGVSLIEATCSFIAANFNVSRTGVRGKVSAKNLAKETRLQFLKELDEGLKR